MQFTRLKLSGFKSFVDPTELLIEPGLTGVVGPNGCGKSNLIEAIRWVMGETSAKKMRGGAMDDVIFSGTSMRPARNLAEVTLSLDNAERAAPAAYNEFDEIEVTRRIERESGSTYLINGQEVRARDVQLLFADLATGAHSTALVNQGQIGDLINAKPIQRRHVLEEAAGITGLYSRRHEAELRLRAAESNIERLEDVVLSMEGQLQGLKRQARQATRYHNISGHIRKQEALLLHLRHSAAESAAGQAAEDLKAAATRVAEITRVAAAATTAQQVIGEKLPPLRQSEAERAAALHRLTIAREGLDAEEARARENQTRLQAGLAQVGSDIAREELQALEAGKQIERLEAERLNLEDQRENEVEHGEAAEAEAVETLQTLTTQESALDAAGQKAAEEDAQRNALGGEIETAQRRLARLTERREQVTTEREQLEEEAAAGGGPDITDDAIAAAVEAAGQAQEAVEAREKARSDSQVVEAQARDLLQTVEKELGRVGGEETALSHLLDGDKDELWPPLIDELTVEAGYEAALGAALGEDLDVPADTGAPVHWREFPPYGAPPALPEGCEALSKFVHGPAALSRRLSQIGMLTKGARGSEVSLRLAQGQRLVSRDGDLWRWDGYTATASAPTPAALRLAQRNRLEELARERADLEARVATAEAKFSAAAEAAQDVVEAEQKSREAARAADLNVRQMQETHARAVAERTRRQARLAGLAESLGEIDGDMGETRTALNGAEAALSTLPSADLARGDVAALRQEVGGLRRAHSEAVNARDQLIAEARSRANRLAAIDQEREVWRTRQSSAGEQIEQLGERRADADAELAAAVAVPKEIAARRVALLDQISAAETARNEAADALAKTEAALGVCEKEARDASQALSTAREDRVRIEARVAQAAQSIEELTSRMLEALNCTPAEAPGIAEIKDGAELPERDGVEHRLERLKRERDNMGPVNLRAEAEADELSEQITSMVAERTDLEQAIARLRQGIASLNREGRERLLTAFKEVDAHFRKMFVRLFGGGEAHLTLTESDDPLEAGLEIMASPPGKRMQTMSLLSGGEQALTAVSLLFAVFLTNPAPICVLDEVDAPLDDANVERFLKLVADIAASAGTRFLIITHNPISMAGMERLFGVTMGERGVSQLVSVDLSQAESLRESA